MKIAILGGTGFIGTHLTEHLLDKGHELIILTRSPEKIDADSSLQAVKWPLESSQLLADVDAMVNLAGETINQRWTEKAKERIYSSRIETTQRLVEHIQTEETRPQVLINASAVGYYGYSEDEQFTEDDSPSDQFFGKLCADWEKEAAQAEAHGVRVVMARLGVVLDRESGALPLMTLPYRLFVGGRVGSGRQWVSWIHIQDVCELIQFALENKSVTGPLNVTAPHPVRNQDFGKVVGKVMNRPHWFPAPAFGLRIALGEMSDLILKGQCVRPEVALKHRYPFAFQHVEDALRDLLY